MTDRSSDSAMRISRAACLWIGLSAALAVPVTDARADAIRVSRRAALGGSRFGLEIEIGGRTGGPPSDAFVAVGPEKGFSNDTALEVGFTLDVSRLSLAQGPGGSGVLPFLRFGETPRPGPARVVVFLERGPSGSWLVGARTWDDATATLVLVDRAPLPMGSPRAIVPPAGSRANSPRLELEWSAASGATPGRVRMLHVRPNGERVVLFERTDLDNASQVVNHVRVGVVAGDQGAGAVGSLRLDDFEVNRTSPALP